MKAEKKKRPLTRRLVEDLTIRVDDAAELLHIDRKLAYEAVRQGKIPSIKVGRLIFIPTAGLRKLLGIPAPK
jgi:excisionase family DNA binding protein